MSNLNKSPNHPDNIQNNRSYSKVLDAYTQGWENREKEINQWISVKDRLPEQNEFVLIYCPQGYGLKIRIMSCVSWLGVENTLSISHWMPLPEPPEKE